MQGPSTYNTFTQIILVGPGQGLFTYSGSPGANNLIGTVGISAAGHDPTGFNATLAGNTTYTFNGAVSQYIATQQFGGGLTFWKATTEAGPWSGIGSMQYTVFNGVLNTLQIVSQNPPNVSFINLASAGVTVGTFSQSPIGSTPPQLEIVMLNSQTNQAFGIGINGDTTDRFSIDKNGQHNWGPGNAATDTSLARTAVGILTLTGGEIFTGAVTFQSTLQVQSGQAESTSGGWSGGPEIGKGNTPNVTNNSSGFPNMLGATISTPSADLSTTGGWRVKEWGHGTWGSTLQALTMSLIVNGGSGPSLTVPTTVQGVSTTFTYELEAMVMPQTLGAGGTFTGYIKMTIFTTGSNVVIFMGESTGIAINTTAAVGWLQQSHWASATGTPTITSDGFTFEKVSL